MGVPARIGIVGAETQNAARHGTPHVSALRLLQQIDYGKEASLCLLLEIVVIPADGTKQASARYTPEATTWVKIKNRQYSQAVGREDFFNRLRGMVE